MRTLPLSSPASEEVSRDAREAFGPVFEASGQGKLEEAVRLLIDVSGGGGYFDAQTPEHRHIHLENAHTMPLLLAQSPPPEVGDEELASLTVPVSVAWGERTRPLFKLPSQALARAIRSGRHTEVSGVGHLWPEESPISFATWVAVWLDSCE